MSKEEQIQEYGNKQLIDELSKMSPMVVATAYLHAINYTLYGEDVTEKWLTATQNASALEKAYQKGYHDAMEKKQRWIPANEKLPTNRDWYLGIFREPDTGWINPIPYVCDYVGERTIATTYDGWILHHCTDQDVTCEYYKKLQCVAWMPLSKWDWEE